MKMSLVQVINPAPLNSTNPTGQSIYSGPSFWPGNGGQVFFRGRRSNQALYRCAFMLARVQSCTCMPYIQCPATACLPLLVRSRTDVLDDTRLPICTHLYRMHAAARSYMRDVRVTAAMPVRKSLEISGYDKATLGCVHRYAWDSATGKLSTTFNAQAEKAVGLFSARAANPVVQAASADATEAVVWEVCQCHIDLWRVPHAGKIQQAMGW